MGDREFARSLSMPLNEAVGKPCPYCCTPMEAVGSKSPSRDHIRPKSRGIPIFATNSNHQRFNRAVVCRQCNEDKGSKSVGNFYKWLRQRNDPRASHVMVFMRRHEAYVASKLRRKQKRGVQVMKKQGMNDHVR